MEFEKINLIIVSSEDLTKILPIKNRNYIAELVRDHNFPRDTHNQYPLIDFIKRYVEYQDELCEKKILKIRELKPQDELARKSAELKDLELKEKQKKLIDSSIVNFAWLNEIHIINTELDGFSIKISDK